MQKWRTFKLPVHPLQNPKSGSALVTIELFKHVALLHQIKLLESIKNFESGQSCWVDQFCKTYFLSTNSAMRTGQEMNANET